jgi:hypothetical protein
MKFLATCLILIASAPWAFADDGSVLPAGVARLRVIPSLTTVNDAYDDAGKTSQASPSYRVFSLNAALEFGVVDAVTLGLKWAPGYKLGSWVDNVSSDLSSNKNMVLTGPEDLEIGAKVLVVGATGLVKNDQFRVAFTPGVSVPLDTYDPKAEFDHFVAGKDYRPQGASAHGSVGLGMRSDVDWLISPVFSVNLHNQVVQYLPREQVEFATYATNAGTYQFLASSPVLADGVTTNPYQGNLAAAKAAADATVPLTKTKTEWGLTYSFEVEPRAELDLGNKTSLTFGLPMTYDSHLKDKSTYNGTTTEENADATLALKPGVDLFVFVGALPLEFKADYSQTVWGKNAGQAGTVAFQVMGYYKFY